MVHSPRNRVTESSLLRWLALSRTVSMVLGLAVAPISVASYAAPQALLRSSYQSWAGYGIENLHKHEPCPLQSLQPFPLPEACFPPGPYDYTSTNGVFHVSIHSPIPATWNDAARQYTESIYLRFNGQLIAEVKDESYTYAKTIVSDGCEPSEPYNFAIQQCGPPVPDKNAGVPPFCPLGNPINQATGNKFHVDVDIARTRSSGLEFTRVYNVTRIKQGFVQNKVLGYGWTGTYLQSLHVFRSGSPLTERVFLKRPDGKQIIFARQGTQWLSDADIHSRLEELIDGRGRRAGWQYISEANTIETYNARGRLEKISDLAGNVSTLVYDTRYGRLDRVVANTGEFLIFDYDAYDRISSVSDQAKRQWRYRYSSNSYNSNLVYVDNPDGTSKQYHYEDASFPHALTGISDERGIRYATYAYDAQGRATLSTHAGNVQRVDVVYNTDDTRTVTNSLGHTSTHTTAVQLGAALVTDISGPGCPSCGDGTISYRYDSLTNNLLSRTSNGVTTEYGDYDAKGQYGYKIEAVGSSEQRRFDYSYDNRFYNKITRIVAPSVVAGHNKVTTYVYDDFGNRLSETINGYDPTGNPVSRTITWQYDGPLHQLSQIDGPRTDVRDVTLYRYYANDAVEGYNRARLREIEAANGALLRSNIQYSATGKVLSELRPNGLTLTYTYYHGNDRLESLTESDGVSHRVTRWSYLPTGEVGSITTGFGSAGATTLSFGYDDARRLTRITDGLGNSIEYTLDTEGNRTFEKVFDNTATLKKQLSQIFDAYNRIDTIEQVNEWEDYNFFPNGALDTLKDGGGAVTDLTYDALKRLTQIVRDRGGDDSHTADTTTEYGYDVADRLISVTDPNRGNTRYVHDDLGNLVSQTSPDTGASTFSYDAAGNLATRTDAKGQVFRYRYDTLNRLTTLDAPGTDDDVSYVYDTCTHGVGRLCMITVAPSASAPVVTSFSYSRLGEVSGHQGVGYTYDSAARLNTLIYPSGASVTYSYDTAGQVSRVELARGGQIQTLVNHLSYQPFGPLSKATFGNGLDLVRHFDTAYRPGSTLLGNLQHHEFGFGANGHLMTLYDLLDPANDHSFSYDALYRVSDSTRLGGQVGGAERWWRLTLTEMPKKPAASSLVQPGRQEFVYDRNGNRTQLIEDGSTTGYAYEPNSNRLSRVASEGIMLDANGNVTTIARRRFVHNANNRIVEVLEGDVRLATYRYNGLGQRVRKDTRSDRTAFVYSIGGQLLGEYREDGSTIREYVYLNGEPLAQINGPGFRSEVIYLHTDHLSTPRWATDSSGALVWSWGSDAFGATPASEDVDGNGTPITVPLRFPGQYYDEETGLHYNYFRYYDPGTGRYLTSDRIGLQGGLNTYVYVGGNPLGYTDPTGEFFILNIGGGLLGAASGAVGGYLASGGNFEGLRNGALAGGLVGLINPLGAIAGGVLSNTLGQILGNRAACTDDIFELNYQLIVASGFAAGLGSRLSSYLASARRSAFTHHVNRRFGSSSVANGLGAALTEGALGGFVSGLSDESGNSSKCGKCDR